ncbi:hypothetical protein JCM10212_004323 [Sporobolomyces blumeae]
MKRAPQVLVDILNDPTIEKQKFGAPSFMSRIGEQEQDFFQACHPTHFLDLRSLATALYPRLEPVDAAEPHHHFRAAYAREALGKRLDVLLGNGEQFAVHRIPNEYIDALTNQTWVSHIAGTLLRSRLGSKVSSGLERDIPALSESKRLPLPTDDEVTRLTDMIVDKALERHTWWWHEIASGGKRA